MSAILESRLEMVKLARQWRYWSRRIAEATKRIIGNCRVYAFGSVVEGRAVGGSDVDVLIVSDAIPERNSERAGLKARIEEEARLPLYHPYEIHLANRREAEWYYSHMGRKVEV